MSETISQPACASCKFWIPRILEPEDDTGEQNAWGECHRNAPLCQPVPRNDELDLGYVAEWPATENSEWCGEFEWWEKPARAVLPPRRES